MCIRTEWGGTCVKRLWRRRGRAGWEPDGSVGVAVSGAITRGRVGLPTHTAEPTWNVDLIFWIFLGTSATPWGWEANEKASVCKHILKAGAALISWESWRDLASPQDMIVTSLLLSHRTCVARNRQSSNVSRILELSREQPSEESCLLRALHVTLRQMDVSGCVFCHVACTRVTIFPAGREVRQRIVGRVSSFGWRDVEDDTEGEEGRFCLA